MKLKLKLCKILSLKKHHNILELLCKAFILTVNPKLLFITTRKSHGLVLRIKDLWPTGSALTLTTGLRNRHILIRPSD